MKGAADQSGGTLSLDAQKRPCRGDTATAGGEEVCVLRHNGRGYRAGGGSRQVARTPGCKSQGEA